MPAEPRLAAAVLTLAALVLPSQALAEGPLPGLSGQSPPQLPSSPVTVTPTVDGSGAAVDVGIGDTIVHAAAGPAGVSIGTRSRTPASPGSGAGTDPGAPVSTPGDRPGRSRTGAGGGPAPVFFGPSSTGRSAVAARGRHAASRRSTSAPGRRLDSTRLGAAPSTTHTREGLPPFLEFVDRIPTSVKAGIAALALLALAIWAAWVRQRRRLERNAYVDPVTGIANVPAFAALLERELERARRYKRPLALLVIDVSEAERRLPLLRDQTLREVAHVIREPLREGDIVARLGPARFAVISPEATEASAETLRRALELRIEEMRLHASGGVAERQPTDLEPDDLLARAEAAMVVPETITDRIRKRAVLRAA
jgi:diguanylate cyclase (GGDEF)-like protein